MKKKYIRQVSVFALSEENVNRSQREIDELWSIYNTHLRKLLEDDKIHDNGVQVRILGNDGWWNPGTKDLVKQLVGATKGYSKHILNVMLAYGSKFEINQAVKSIVGKPISTLDKFLLVKDPLDLIIRTGGQCRLSNFMLYQASYAEIYFSPTLWPDFKKTEFEKIMRWYFAQQKNFGR